jgi:hypothetical protein
MGKIVAVLLVLFGLGADHNGRSDLPDAEFQLARMKYRTVGGGGSHGYFQPWWAIDYPEAEEHFFPALRRITNIQVAEEERQLEITDDRVFDYPFLFMQQPGRGFWNPKPNEAQRLREYLDRGGFLLVDDLHGESDWRIFADSIRRVFPDKPIVDVPPDDMMLHVFFDLDPHTPIPGKRHLRVGPGGRIYLQMQGVSQWRGIYDDRHHLMVLINFNMDMGDSWEHADDPEYPVPMTVLGYQVGVNSIVYAMTH